MWVSKDYRKFLNCASVGLIDGFIKQWPQFMTIEILRGDISTCCAGDHSLQVPTYVITYGLATIQTCKLHIARSNERPHMRQHYSLDTKYFISRDQALKSTNQVSSCQTASNLGNSARTTNRSRRLAATHPSSYHTSYASWHWESFQSRRNDLQW